MNLLDIVLVVGLVTNGLLAGLFFTFTCAVSPALGRLDDRLFVEAFRSINAVILNGWFLSVFFLAPAAAIAAAVWGGIGHHASFAWLLGGAGCAALTFVITSAANVPLNNALAAAAPATPAQYEGTRRAFEAAWNRWNLTRTLTSVGALTLLACAIAG